jgi:hypothetical protein
MNIDNLVELARLMRENKAEWSAKELWKIQEEIHARKVKVQKVAQYHVF